MPSEPTPPDPRTTSTPATNGSLTSGPVICVFCGSSTGTSPAHLAAAHSLAQVLHTHNATLIYGGGTTGLMGAIARTLVSLSGPTSVHGIIPAALLVHEHHDSSPNGSPNSTIFGRTTIVQTMHERKSLMAQLVKQGGPGSGFIALSGGYGTMEELMEMVTWNQLGLHDRGVVVYNVDGYWDGLMGWIGRAVEGGFVAEGNRGILVEAGSAEEAVRCLGGYRVSEERMRLDWGDK